MSDSWTETREAMHDSRTDDREDVGSMSDMSDRHEERLNDFRNAAPGPMAATTYAVRWSALDGTGDEGYLRSFDSRDDATEYAIAYARSVATTYHHSGTVSVHTFPDFVVIAEDREGYRERVTVTEREG